MPEGALWVHIQVQDGLQEAWLWRPIIASEQGDLDTLARMRETNWQPVEADQHPLRSVLLWGQLAEVRQVNLPKRLLTQIWARGEDLRQIERVPVALAFTLPAGRSQGYTSQEETITVSDPLPPPSIGEYALIASNQTWMCYPLSSTKEEGYALWRQMNDALTDLASQPPAEAQKHLHTIQPLAQRLAEMYWQRHQQAQYEQEHRRIQSLPALTSKHRTRMPSTNSFRALAQSFGPSVQATLWNGEAEGTLELVTPNGSLLSVKGANEFESAVLHQYVMEVLGPEGLKHMIGLLDAYYVQTGGKERKLDARISLEDFLERIGKGGKARERGEQVKLMQTILYLASTFITSDERRYIKLAQQPLPYAGHRRSRKQIERRDYSPLLVIERLKPGPDGSIRIPSQVEFHLGADYFETLFGSEKQFFSVPTAQLLSYHAIREQQELMLGVYLSNLIVISGGRCTVDFTTLLVQSALQTLDDLTRGENRTRDALRVLYALEHLEQDGLIARALHADVDLVLAVELATGASTNKHLALATHQRIAGEPYATYLPGLPPEKLKSQRRVAIQRLLDKRTEVAPLVFEAGPLLLEQARRRADQRSAAAARVEQANTARIVQAAAMRVIEAIKSEQKSGEQAEQKPPPD